MPSPKNSSLGRGLGDLMGGLPQTIGVAQHPPAEAKNTDPSKDDIQEQSDLSTPEKAPPVPSWWTPPRLVMVGASGILLVLIGIGIGVVVRDQSADLVKPGEPGIALRVVVITNTVVVPASVPAAAVDLPPRIDAAVFQALEPDGLVCSVEESGSVRLTFTEALFVSRIVLDPGQGALLTRLGAVLTGHTGEWDVVLSGHTDATPLKSGGQYRDNEELGLGRAMEVARFLHRQAGVPMAMIHAVSEGEANPPHPGDDAEARRKNRTVTILVRPAALSTTSDRRRE